MIKFLARRVLTMAVTLFIISALVFFIIKLPPGDFLTNQIAELRAQGEAASAAKAEFLVKQYGLDRPVWEQYLVWIGVWPGPNGFSGLIQGDWGWSFEFDKPVNEVVGDALWLTLLVNLAVVIFVHLVSIPIAIYSATRQYSVGDYIATFIGYIGLATPSFLLALILLYYTNRWFGVSIGGLYDPSYAGQPWTWPKIQSLLSHLVVPTLVIGLSGTAAMIRRMRPTFSTSSASNTTSPPRPRGCRRPRRFSNTPSACLSTRSSPTSAISCRASFRARCWCLSSSACRRSVRSCSAPSNPRTSSSPASS